MRFSLATVFIIHGLLKWQDLSSTAAFFVSLGIPQWLVYVVAAIEVVGGVVILFGWFARFFSLCLAVIMVVAIVTAKFSLGFVGGYEFEFVLLASALAIVLAGPGKYRLKVLNRNNQQIY